MFWYFFISSLAIIIILAWCMDHVVAHHYNENIKVLASYFNRLDNKISGKIEELEQKVEMLELKTGCGYRAEKVKEIFSKSSSITLEDFKDI